MFRVIYMGSPGFFSGKGGFNWKKFPPSFETLRLPAHSKRCQVWGQSRYHSHHFSLESFAPPVSPSEESVSASDSMLPVCEAWVPSQCMAWLHCVQCPRTWDHKTESEGENSDFTQVWGMGPSRTGLGPWVCAPSQYVIRDYKVRLGLLYLDGG